MLLSELKTRGVETEPFYFGRDGDLFGLHLSPLAATPRDIAILLCYPIGHEYIVGHRAYRQLSLRLTAVGFHVMRFDYHASGDSGGECSQGRPRRWIRDISTAIGELRLRSGANKVCLVGCRLGATFAAMVGADRGDIEHMVLWDPIENGSDHMAAIARRHLDMLRQTHVAKPSTTASSDVREFLGFAMAEQAAQEIAAINLLELPAAPATHVLLIESDTRDTSVLLRQFLTRRGAEVTHRRLPVANAWKWIEDVGTVPVPQQILHSISSWLIEVDA